MQRRFVLVVLLAVSMVGIVRLPAASAEGGPESAEQAKKEVLEINEKVDQALLAKDADALAPYLSEDLDYTNQFGELVTKAEWLANIRSGKLTNVDLKHEMVHLHVFGNAVVAVGLSHTTLIYQGKVSHDPRRFTRVFVKQDGGWRLVAQHVTLIAKP
jgi:ketosteroid isomerase-like protein